MESFNWVIALGFLLFGIIRLIANANQKQEGQTPGGGTGPTPRKSLDRGPARPAGGSFTRMLEELSRQLNDQPSPTVSHRPLASSQPEPTSEDYYSLEEEYDAMDSRARRSEYNAEDFDAERRYVGGEMRGTGGTSGRHQGNGSGEYYEDEITAYKRLAAERTRRSTPLQAKVVKAGAANYPAAAVVDAAANPVPVAVSTTDPAAGNNSLNTLRELLGDDFDLRRAVIESEILTPKYL